MTNPKRMPEEFDLQRAVWASKNVREAISQLRQIAPTNLARIRPIIVQLAALDSDLNDLHATLTLALTPHCQTIPCLPDIDGPLTPDQPNDNPTT